MPDTPSPLALIESKLVPPQLAPGLLARPQLSTLLHTGLHKRLVGVAAAAGYGKTTALAQFVSQTEPLGITTAWLSLDAEDNDPLRFMRYLAAALHHADASLGRGALAQTDGGSLVSLDAIAAALLQDLLERDRRLLLVLDDFHLVHNDAVHRKLEWLIAHLPPTVALVIASRTRLPLQLSQLRLRGELLEIDAACFGLALDEAADFVGRVNGVPLDRAQVETLHHLTEGWIAGLQLASLALRGSDDKSAFLSAFSGTDRDITDYLGEQVLDSLRPALRDFLLDTAGLDRFCAELCDEVLQRDDSRAMLAEIETRNLFLSGLDRSRTWFRYHHLFADYLRGRSKERPAGVTRAIALRASDWFNHRRLPHEAVRYAFDAHDPQRAADLVAEFSAELVQHRGEHATLLGWLARLPQALVHANPKIRIGHAWSLVLTRRHAEADAELRALEAVDGADDSVRWVVEMIRCMYFALSDQPVAAKTASEAWLRNWPQADAFCTGVTANVLAAGCCATDAFEQGLQALAIARRAFEECGAHYGLAWASALAMMLAMRRGDHAEAMAQAQLGLATVEHSLGIASYAGSMLTLLAAEVSYEQGELAQAERYLALGRPFIDEHGLVEMSAAGYRVRARLLRLNGEAAAADACLLEGESLGHRLKLPRLAHILAAERCALRHAAASLDEALKLAQSYGFMGHGGAAATNAPALADDHVTLVMLRLRFARGTGPDVIGALGDAIRRAQRDGHQAQLARLTMLKAVQQHRAGERAQALRTLDEALALAARCGLVRSVLDADPLLLDMVETFTAGRLAADPAGTAAGVPIAWLQRVLRLAGRSTDAAPQSAPMPLAATEALTERELRILRLLKEGLGNRELAQSLFLSEATVKWHLHNIFAKLGVKNRTGALARAQQLL